MKYLVFFVFIAILLIANLGIQPSPVEAQPISQAEISTTYIPVLFKPGGNNWPMAAANSARTSWTPEEVRGRLDPVWYRPIEPMIPAKVQLIAAYGTIYISTARGLYALDAQTGAEKWVYPTELPLGHSPTIVDGIAYVGGFDHKIHAVNAYTGQGLWIYEAGAGFDTNPLVVDGVLYAGNRDGFMYAISIGGPNLGQLIWKFLTGGPINFSAAYKDGTIYFASNDSYAYALDAESGELIWKSAKLPGAGFHSWWPVVYNDVIVFPGSSNYRSTMRPGNGQYIVQLDRDDVFPDYDQLPGGTLIGSRGEDGWIYADRVLEYYEEKPWRRTYFVLDKATGQEITYDFDGDGQNEYAPLLWFGTHAGNRYPPVVGGDNILYQTAFYATGNYSIPRGQVSGWQVGTPYLSTPSYRSKAVDEPLAYAAGGNVIYWNHCCDRSVGAFDITIQNATTWDPSREWIYFDGATLGDIVPGYNVMHNSTDLDTVYGNTNGIYGSHGDQNPPIPYQGKVYIHRSNAVIAFGDQSSPPVSLPIAQSETADSPTINISVAQLESELVAEVEKILDAGHLRPGFIVSGLFDQAGKVACGDHMTDYWHDPTDSIYTLIVALPYLPEDLQQSVRDYLQNEFTNYSPYQYVHIGWRDGAQREAHDLPPEVDASRLNSPPSEYINNLFEAWHFPPHIFYTLWKYAQIFGGAEDTFDASKARLDPVPPNDILEEMPFVHNSNIAGYFGYLELEKLAGEPESEDVRAELNRLLDLRVTNFSKDSPYGTLICTPSSGGCGCKAVNISRNFLYLTPELGQHLRTHALPQVQEAVDEYNVVAPYWFVSNYEQTYGEGVIQPVFNGYSIFQARALILQEPYEILIKYLDVPGVTRGDFYYIQNLVAAIEAGTTD